MLGISKFLHREKPLMSAIAAVCGTDERKGDRMRSIILEGLKRGTIPVLNRPPLARLQTINAVMASFEHCGFYDFKILSAPIEASLRSDPSCDEIVDFLSLITRLGHYDEKIILLCCASIIRSGEFGNLTALQRAELVRVLALQRVRLPELVSELLKMPLTLMGNARASRIQLDLSSLQLSDSAYVQTSPETVQECMNLTKAFILRGGGNQSSTDDTARISEYIDRMARNGSQFNTTDVSLIWYALNYCEPELYEKLTNAGRKWLTGNATAEAVHFKSRADMASYTRFRDSVSNVLFRLNVRHSRQVPKGPFMLDIVETSRKVVWSCDKPSRFYVGPDNRMRTSYFQLQDRILRAMGYEVIHIPYWHWERITTPQSRRDYCKMSSFLAQSGSVLAPHSACLGGQLDSFDVSRLTAAETQQSAYHGERFLRKEAPHNPWSWHKSCSPPVKVSL